MGKISSYTYNTSPALTDFLLGDSAAGPTTYNYKLSDLDTLFFNNVPASTIKAAAIDFTSIPATYREGNGGASRQTLGASVTASVAGTAIAYTNPTSKPITILVRATALINIASGGGYFFLANGGAQFGRIDYGDNQYVGKYVTYKVEAPLTVAAGATVNIDARVTTTGTSGTSIANASADVANGYSPSMSIITLPSQLTLLS